MDSILTYEQGSDLVKHVRVILELKAKSTNFNPEMVEKNLQAYSMTSRVKVRLLHYPTGTQIAESDVVGPAALSSALVRATLSVAALAGSAHLYRNSIDEMTVELLILGAPMLLQGSYIKRRSSINPAVDGIMLTYGNHKAMVFPDSSLQRNTMLEEVCKSAGLPSTYWTQGKVQLYKFSTQRFIEATPNGAVALQ